MNEENTKETSAKTTSAQDNNQNNNQSIDKSNANEMSVKTRKIIGVVIMVVGVVMVFVLKDLLGGSLAGIMILFAGMWTYNPEIKDNSNSTIVPTWLGVILIIAISALLAWLYANFVA